MKYKAYTDKLRNGGGGSGVSVVGPAMDFGRSHSYFMRCDSPRYMACRQWSLVRYSWSSEEYVTVYSAPRELFPGPHPSSAYMFTFAIAFDEDAQIVYWYAQTVNEYGWGSLFSLDISAFEPGETTYRPSTRWPRGKLRVAGATWTSRAKATSLSATPRASGRWI